MTEDRRTAVLLIQKLVHEHVHCCAEGVQGEISDIFGESEQRKGRAERQMRERRLQANDLSVGMRKVKNQASLTSTATPGRNITTARAWKNLRLAFRLNVGTCLSAASSRSVATFAPLANCGKFERFGRLGRLGKLGRFGRFGKLEKVMPNGPVGSMLGTESGVFSLVCAVVDKEGFDLGISATGGGVPGGVLMGTSLTIVASGRGRYRLERASCLFHPATLILPRAAQ